MVCQREKMGKKGKKERKIDFFRSGNYIENVKKRRKNEGT
jgi:hypothetical protein